MEFFYSVCTLLLIQTFNLHLDIFGFGILLVDQLNQIPFFGFKFGFWWAQQGSIYVFIGLIFFYTYKMKKIDRQFGVSDDDEDET